MTINEAFDTIKLDNDVCEEIGLENIEWKSLVLYEAHKVLLANRNNLTDTEIKSCLDTLNKLIISSIGSLSDKDYVNIELIKRAVIAGGANETN